jgi:lactate permease
MFDIILALSPIVIILIMVLMFRKSLAFSGFFVLLYVIAIAILYWKIESNYLYISGLKGIFVSLDIMLIVFGALFFLEFKETEMVKSIKEGLSSISRDSRILAILLVWFLGSFIEGIAGFGTPAAIIAPLLVTLGFAPVLAVAVALIGTSTAVVFGAVGTPIRIGFSTIKELPPDLIFNSALINSFVGIFIPLMIVAVIVMSKKNYKIKEITEMIPYSIFAGLCLTVPYFLISFIGQEFPSIIGPLIGLSVIIFTTKKGFLVPEEKISFDKKPKEKYKVKFIFFVPYLLLIVFLLLGKIFLGSITINLLGGVEHKINLFNPGLAFILVIFISNSFIGRRKDLRKPALKSIKRLKLPFIAILSIVCLVQIMIYSDNNYSGIQGMIDLIASLINGRNLIIFSPIIGAFGAFMAGSATVSNMLFGEAQILAAKNSVYPGGLILSLQLIGAGIGNIVALTNMVAAQATVGLHGKEKEILHKTLIPFLLYLLLVIIIGFLINLLLY